MKKHCDRCGAANRRHSNPYQCIEWLLARLNEYRADCGYATATKWRDKCLQAEAARFFLCALMTNLIESPTVHMMGFAKASAAKMSVQAAGVDGGIRDMAASIMDEEVKTWTKSQS